MEERVLSLLAANETAEGAAQVLRAHGPEVLRYLRAILRDETAADDAFSLFAEWTWEGLSRFRGESSLRTFAFGIAWNAARRVRDEAWRKRRERLSSGAAAKLANEIRTSSLLERERRADALEELRRELSGDEQNLLALRIDQRLSWARRPHGARAGPPSPLKRDHATDDSGGGARDTWRMCRNIKTLYHFEPPATEDEVRASALQYVRKLSGLRSFSKANQEACEHAVEHITEITLKLFDQLEVHGPPRSREVERQKALERGKKREQQLRKRVLRELS